MLNFLTRWNKRRNTIKELNRLTDRDLADIGLRRSDLEIWVKKNM